MSTEYTLCVKWMYEQGPAAVAYILTESYFKKQNSTHFNSQIHSVRNLFWFAVQSYKH